MLRSDQETARVWAILEDVAGMQKLEKGTKMDSALNLLILQIPTNGRPQIFVKHYFKWKQTSVNGQYQEQTKRRSSYYQMMYQKLGSGIAVFSSSLSMEDKELRGARALPTDDLISLLEL